MHKSTLLFLFFLCAFSAQAQVALEKGTTMHDLSGNIYIPFNGSSFGMNANYKRGWFVSQKTVVGADIALGVANSSFTYGLGGFARSYFGDPTAKTLFFGEFGMGFGNYSNSSYGSSNAGFTFAIGPGVSFRAGENVLVNLSPK